MNPISPLGPAPTATLANTASTTGTPTGALATGGGDFAATLRQAAATSASATGRTVAPGLAGRAVLDRALLSLGRPAAGGPATFAAEAFARLGVTLPPTVAEQATMGVSVADLGQARSGDLVVLGQPPDQVGIYAGRGRMVHVPADGGPVRLSEITGPVAGIRRIVAEPVVAIAGAPVGLTAPLGLRSGAGLEPSAATPSLGTTGIGGAAAPFAELFRQAGARHGLDPALLAAVAATESGFDPTAVSRAGAQGLMQFMPATAASLGVDPWDAASAIDGAARYLRQGLDRFGSVGLALAAYNAGPGAVQRHGGVPPYPETQRYVRKVLEAMEQYR